MHTRTIVNGSAKYAGKFVATESFNTKTVVAFGTDPCIVRKRAIKKGFNTPVVFFIPTKNMIHVF